MRLLPSSTEWDVCVRLGVCLHRRVLPQASSHSCPSFTLGSKIAVARISYSSRFMSICAVSNGSVRGPFHRCRGWPLRATRFLNYKEDRAFGNPVCGPHTDLRPSENGAKEQVAWVQVTEPRKAGLQQPPGGAAGEALPGSQVHPQKGPWPGEGC